MRIFGFRPALGPTLFTIPAIALMLVLGTWQVQRMNWKLDLLQTIHDRMVAAPVPLPAGQFDPVPWEYRQVTITGRFRHAQEIHLLAYTERGNLGYQVFTPLERSDGAAAGQVVIVDRGWVPTENKDAATRQPGQVEDLVTVTGLARLPWRQGWFVPDNEVAKNIWFYGDVTAMQLLDGIQNMPAMFVAAGEAPNPGGLPIGGQTVLTLPNNHLEYALTWYAGAVVLAAIYVIWHRRRDNDAAGKAQQK